MLLNAPDTIGSCLFGPFADASSTGLEYEVEIEPGPSIDELYPVVWILCSGIEFKDHVLICRGYTNIQCFPVHSESPDNLLDCYRKPRECGLPNQL
jgi:hypothetical protein